MDFLDRWRTFTRRFCNYIMNNKPMTKASEASLGWQSLRFFHPATLSTGQNVALSDGCIHGRTAYVFCKQFHCDSKPRGASFAEGLHDDTPSYDFSKEYYVLARVPCMKMKPKEVACLDLPFSDNTENLAERPWRPNIGRSATDSCSYIEQQNCATQFTP